MVVVERIKKFCVLESIDGWSTDVNSRANEDAEGLIPSGIIYTAVRATQLVHVPFHTEMLH